MKNITETLITMFTLPFALIGGVWGMYWLDYNWSIAVAIGFIALAGLAAETGIIMHVMMMKMGPEVPRGWSKSVGGKLKASAN